MANPIRSPHLDVWVGSETPEYVKMNASSIAEIDKEQVEVHITFAGGSFGLHSSAERDPTAEAVQIAQGARLEAPDQGPVAARGGIQSRPLPRDGRSPRPGRRRRRRSPRPRGTSKSSPSRRP